MAFIHSHLIRTQLLSQEHNIFGFINRGRDKAIYTFGINQLTHQPTSNTKESLSY